MAKSDLPLTILELSERKNAIPNVKGPNLPKNITMVKIILPISVKSEVMPMLSPTVPSAEAVSKQSSIKEWFSTMHIKKIAEVKIEM